MKRRIIIAAILLFASAVSASMQVTDESSNVITDESGNTLMFPPYVSTFSVPGSGQSYLLLK